MVSMPLVSDAAIRKICYILQLLILIFLFMKFMGCSIVTHLKHTIVENLLPRTVDSVSFMINNEDNPNGIQ